ncbi:NADH_oxidase [Hexamita inflata]|uniref:NADH oxidase n=1 Tax=Hexamita inflata TaxID=28002 RepID=A0AA86TZD8_9EUKA|nr:NADH oxidase [Hexamita inflata]CAI9926008.1 NADH oxidase [Hexamita inflata]
MGCGSGQQAIQEDIQKQEQIYPIKLHQETIAIIGCTHAGTTAAISLRNLNKNVRIIVFEKNPAVAFLNCGIHLVINKTCDDLNKLFYNSPNKMKSLGIDIHECTSIEGVDFKAKQLNAVNLLNQEKSSYQYDKLIISTGSNPVIPPIIQGLDYKNDPVRQLRADYKRILLCKTYQDAQRLIKLSAEKVCIIGSGHIGMELVWSFNSIGSKVTVVDHGHHILAKYFDIEYVNILEQECRKLGIEISSNSKVIKLSENEHKASVLIQRTVEGVVKTLNAEFDYVIICAGFIPNTENIIQWSENTLVNMNKIIVVDKQQRTSIENVYAIGDCATCLIKYCKSKRTSHSRHRPCAKASQPHTKPLIRIYRQWARIKHMASNSLIIHLLQPAQLTQMRRKLYNMWAESSSPTTSGADTARRKWTRLFKSKN